MPWGSRDSVLSGRGLVYSIIIIFTGYSAFPADLNAAWRIAITYLTRPPIDIIDVTKVNIL